MQKFSIYLIQFLGVKNVVFDKTIYVPMYTITSVSFIDMYFCNETHNHKNTVQKQDC